MKRWPWGQYVATSNVAAQGQTMFSISFTISMNNDWVEPVSSSLGFGRETQPRPLVVVVPFWFVVIVFSIPPFVWIRRTIRDRNAARTACARTAATICAPRPGGVPSAGATWPMCQTTAVMFIRRRAR